MAKNKAPSILDVIPSIDNGTLQPVYYFFGEDYYLLQNVLDLISKAVSPLITSDFDKDKLNFIIKQFSKNFKSNILVFHIFDFQKEIFYDHLSTYLES